MQQDQQYAQRGDVFQDEYVETEKTEAEAAFVRDFTEKEGFIEPPAGKNTDQYASSG